MEWKLYSEAGMAGKLRPLRNGEVCGPLNWREFLREDDGMIADQLAQLKAENGRQSSRIAFLEAALETALAAQTELRALNSELGDENYELRHLSPKEQSVVHNALRRSATLVHKASLSESLSRALRLPNTPDPYGR